MFLPTIPMFTYSTGILLLRLNTLPEYIWASKELDIKRNKY